jgi:hypothetical protein
MNYHTQHSPRGAHASFTIGLPGARGGFGQSLPGPADQDIYIGYRPAGATGPAPAAQPGERWRLLPFYRPPRISAASAFTGDTSTPARVGEPVALDSSTVRRWLGWASDTWTHEKFSFRILTCFERAADPATLDRDAARHHFAPAVTAEISFDNTSGSTPVELVFGVGNTAEPPRPLEESRPPLSGFAIGQNGRYAGFAARAADISARLQGLNLFDPASARDHRGLHLLGHEAALVFRIPAGERRSFPLALAFYQGGVVTTGLKACFYYTKLFRDLEDVLSHALDHHARHAAVAAARDAELAAAPGLDDDQRWLIAQATHSYFGSTELLLYKGRPLWVVNEGEYRMMNTFDLAVDQLFFELEWHPWAMRDTLDLFARRYCYRDTIHRPSAAGARPGRRVPGGLSFTHDMGTTNHFTQRGRSSYECDDLRGCFSHMTVEQLLNWICCACVYAAKTGDRDWLRRRQKQLLACARSLARRDDPRPARRTGLLKWDSDRCGAGGGEITTYDSLDVALGQARNNLYISVKTIAAWTLLQHAFAALGLDAESASARAAADLAADAIAAKFEEDTGMFPAVFEAGNRSRILPAVEGLVYPLYLGYINDLRARHPALFSKLSRHLSHVLQPGVCIDAQSGAWKISSTSNNTWFSKIAIAQHVARRLFPESLNAAARAADAVHANMQKRAPLGQFAMVDQVHSATGHALGSRYYPRIVSACLWMEK